MFDLETEADVVQREALPWLIFEIKGELYAVNSTFVNYIMTMPDHVTKVPDMDKIHCGLIPFQDSYVSLLSMRTLFGLNTLPEEYEAFKAMIEDRKQDHLHWVSELKRCTYEDEPFTLATDPHQCAFGHWYDGFVSEVQSINSHMTKIDAPHKKLHQTAERIAQYQAQQHDHEKIHVNHVLDELENEIVPIMVKLLDETKDIFSSFYREMVIVLDDNQKKIGLVVDGVRSVDELEMLDGKMEAIPNRSHETYVTSVARLPNSDAMVFIMDGQQLVHS